VAQSVADPLTTHQVNVDGTLLLLLAARDAGVRRFVFASSSAVYGDSPALPKSETMPTGPISPYGLHKLAGEVYCQLFHRLYGLPTVALRYFNVFGPRQDPSSEYSGVISRFIETALLGRSATIFGDGDQTRDFIFVDNVVQANLLAADAGEAAVGQAYNIACGEETSLLQLVELIGDLAGGRVAPRHDPPRRGDIRQSRADVQKAASALGFETRVGLLEGLSRTVDWRRTQS
jgi:UDP-glucose 4-epimerase